MKRQFITLIAATALVCAGLVAVAAAHTVKYDSTVTIHQKKNGTAPDSFAGRVICQQNVRCESNRTVKVKQVVAGPDILVGTDVTDANGNWEYTLAGAAPKGTYHAVATRSVLRQTTQHHHVCKRAVSSDLTVH